MSWKPETYKASKIDEMIKDQIIVTPSYQRGAKWSESQRASLIDSIKRGFPFGSILLNKRLLSTGQVRYDLIDGLQRCTTINKFLNEPGKYFKGDDIKQAQLVKIYDLIDASEKNQDRTLGLKEIEETITQYVQSSLTTMEQVKSIQYYSATGPLRKKWPSLESHVDKLISIMEDLFKPFKATCTSLTDAEIPAIVYEGDQALLPEVFERINSKGTTLSKYDIYAASWGSDVFQITDSDFDPLYDSICKRYEEMNDSEIRVADFDAVDYKSKKEIRPFDLCYAFGKMLKTKYPLLFGSLSDQINVDSIGFNLINACLGKHASELGKLNIAMKAYGSKIQPFLRSILKSCGIVYDYLKVIITLKGNSKSGVSILHSENQIISMVASVFLAMYCKPEKNPDDERIVDVHFDNNVNESWGDKDEKFKKAMPIVYVQDSLSSVWSGTGDKRLYSIICDQAYFTRDYLKEDFENAFRTWFKEICSRNEVSQVKNPSSADKIVLNIYTSQTVSASDAHNSETWDIEHICPKKVMKDRIRECNNAVTRDEDKIALPISSIGNLCYLPSSLNRTKEEKTIYQAGLNASDLADVENKYTLTQKEDLDWIDDPSLTAQDFKKRYLSFVQGRSERVLKLMTNYLFGETPEDETENPAQAE